MAAVPRTPSSAEPTAAPASAVVGSGIARVPLELRGDWFTETQAIKAQLSDRILRSHPRKDTSLLTGAVAMVRGGTPPPPEVVTAALVAGAEQRAGLAGIADPALIQAAADYRRETGRYPDLSQLDPSALEATGGGLLGLGLSTNMLLAIGAALVLVLLLTRSGKGGRR
jgi:hypothetical protein